MTADFKIATWNINSLRVRLEHLLSWLRENQPDVIALQETKLPDADFPLAMIEEAGYTAVFAGQRAYNGVAILSRKPITDLMTDLSTYTDPQRRILIGTYEGIRIINLYVPNGQRVGSEKYQYKLTWLEHILQLINNEMAQYPKLIVLGDFNIAPQPIDVHDPKRWQGKVLFSEAERAAFAKFLQLGLIDVIRHQAPLQEKLFTWWDYRLFAISQNLGLRIDHILTSPALLPSLNTTKIDTLPRFWERPSDHAPVLAEFKL